MKKKRRYYYSTFKSTQDVYHILKGQCGITGYKTLCGHWNNYGWEISDTPPKGRRLCLFCKLRLESTLKLRTGRVIHAKQKELI